MSDYDMPGDATMTDNDPRVTPVGMPDRRMPPSASQRKPSYTLAKGERKVEPSPFKSPTTLDDARRQLAQRDHRIGGWRTQSEIAHELGEQGKKATGWGTCHVTGVKFTTSSVGKLMIALFLDDTKRWSEFTHDETNHYLLDALEDAELNRDGAIHDVDWTVFWGRVDAQNVVLNPIQINAKEDEPMAVKAQTDAERKQADFIESAKSLFTKYAFSDHPVTRDNFIQKAIGCKLPTWDGDYAAAVDKLEQLLKDWKNPPAKPAVSEFDTFDQPAPDEPKTAEWIKDTAKKNTFFGRWVKMCNEFGVPEDKDLREGLRKETLKRLTGDEHLSSWERSAAELLTELNKDLLAKYGEKPTAENAPESPARAETQPAAVTTPEPQNAAPVAPVVSAEPTNEPAIDKAQFRKERMIAVGTSKPNYLKASDRVIMFRADHPDWSLQTEALQLLPDFAVFKALIYNADGILLATGHGFCTPDLAKKVSGRFVEKAETAAIARALSLLGGYGSDDTLDDSDYLSDSPKAA